jgi:hypothetical protein
MSGEGGFRTDLESLLDRQNYVCGVKDINARRGRKREGKEQRRGKVRATLSCTVLGMTSSDSQPDWAYLAHGGHCGLVEVLRSVLFAILIRATAIGLELPYVECD